MSRLDEWCSNIFRIFAHHTGPSGEPARLDKKQEEEKTGGGGGGSSGGSGHSLKIPTSVGPSSGKF